MWRVFGMADLTPRKKPCDSRAECVQCFLAFLTTASASNSLTRFFVMPLRSRARAIVIAKARGPCSYFCIAHSMASCKPAPTAFRKCAVHTNVASVIVARSQFRIEPTGSREASSANQRAIKSRCVLLSAYAQQQLHCSYLPLRETNISPILSASKHSRKNSFSEDGFVACPQVDLILA
jgi:hypothetical protein